VETLAELRERRAFECRLTADRALASLAKADAFLRDRGLLTRTPDCALPSLHGACHEDPYQPGGHGFAAWPAPARALGDLLVASVGAAVVAPEAELRRWFSWPWYWTDTVVGELAGEGRLRRVDGQVTAAG
jgi:hypothetical protein